ncbi:unnamed protein product [Rotaria sp. Silwood2]|nr:unnamed protein product [Rotaria sp. Silwood2]
MDLDLMINTSQDENDYINYGNRLIRPMDQDILSEAFSRLPIFVDKDELINNSHSNRSIKILCDKQYLYIQQGKQCFWCERQSINIKYN